MHKALLLGVSVAFLGTFALPALAANGPAADNTNNRPRAFANGQAHAYGIYGKHKGGGGGGGAVAVPGPVAGAGLPILLVAGGYYYLRRRRQAAQAAE